MKKAGIFVLTAIVIVTGVFVMGNMKNQKITEAVASTTEYTNHLADAYSPYLRQHMHNPVDWYSWGDAALKKAKAENKPILVSIGYYTCYWCHVLEREVFSDEEIAQIMNKNFISIKVDREVRPDIDEIYMFATQAMTGRGGWPNNVFLTPDLKPFFAVTYLPRDKWMTLIKDTVRLWSDDRNRLEQQADQTTAAIQRFFQAGQPLRVSFPAGRLADEYYANLQMSYDGRSGGFGAGTKFPQEPNLLFLLDYAKVSKNEQALSIVQNTVDHMMAGGIHDHIGGGFHRYATDREWLVPHFEKMLYNQGQMASILAGLYERTGKPEYKRALTRLLDFVARDMTTDNGGFYSAWDAETDAVEGAFYVWNKEELKQALGQEDSDFLLARYGFTALPHFPGHKYPDGEVLYQKTAIEDQAAWNRLDGIFEKLQAARSKRDKPLRDDKIITAWNGIMIEGLANAGRMLNDPAYVRQAEKAARFILGNMRDKDGKLSRIYMKDQPHQSAFLDDYAWLAKGLTALYRATGNEYYKNQAISLVETADKYLLDAKSGSYYLTDGSDKLPVRIRQGMDTGALPSDNAVMAHVFVDLYHATNDGQWKDRTEALVGAFGQGFSGQAGSYGHLIYALLRLQEDNSSPWLHPVVTTVAEKTPPAAPAELASKDKVKVHTHILHDQSTPTKKIIEVTVDIEGGWHLNANPASMDFLIPTVADIQANQKSKVEVIYPNAEKLTTPLGEINVYAGQIKIKTVVTSSQPIDEKKLRLLLQVQACKETTCYPPSQIAVNVSHDGC